MHVFHTQFTISCVSTLVYSRKMLTVVVRMFTTYIYQSSGLLIDQSVCHSDGQTAVYGKMTIMLMRSEIVLWKWYPTG